MGNQERDQIGNGEAYLRITTDKKRPRRNDHTTKPGGNILTLKYWQLELWRPHGTGRDWKTTKIQHLKRRIPKPDTRTTMPQVRTTGTLGQELPEKRWTQTIQPTIPELATFEKTAPWQTRPKIREIKVKRKPEQSGNDLCPQEEMV